MARIALIEPDQATGKTKDVFDRVKAYYQMVPGLQKGLAHLPETTDALWTLSLTTASEGTIREELKLDDIVLVALTGWGGADDRARTKAAGFDRHMTKPVTIGAIEAFLANPAEWKARA